MLPGHQPGRSFVLTTDDAGGLSPGAPVLFRGLAVGKGSGNPPCRGEGGAEGGTGKGARERQVEIPVLVEAKYADFVRKTSAFWQAGGLSVSMNGGLDVGLPSLQSLISGAVAFDTPEAFAGPPAGPDAIFRLYGSRDMAKAAPEGPVFAYFVRFPKAVGGLRARRAGDARRPANRPGRQSRARCRRRNRKHRHGGRDRHRCAGARSSSRQAKTRDQWARC